MLEGLVAVRRRIATAARDAGRDPSAVRVVAVTKGRTVDEIRRFLEDSDTRAAIHALGENRVQEALPKIAALGTAVPWHLVGRLQTNKVRSLGTGFALVHSVDRPEIAEALARRIPGIAVLVQVNVSGEASKAGVPVEDAAGLARLCLAAGLDLRGLTTIAPQGDPAAARGAFEGLARLRDETAAALGTPLPELSMGMSDDLEEAVVAGATLVRVGRALFGPRAPDIPARGEMGR